MSGAGNSGAARLEKLVALSRALGRPERDYVILAEGNTSALLEDGSFLVKASGARLDGIEARDFVRLRLAPLLEAVLDDGELAETEVRELLRAARVEPSPGPGEPSIETFVHVVALGLGSGRYVAHTHPTVLNGLLCAAAAEEIFSGPLFPDEVVVCGPASLYVPYFEPGLAVARALAPRLRAFVDQYGEPPRAILLGNHGLVALGQSVAEAEAVTAMAVKAARIRAGAIAAGGARTLAAVSVAELAGRADELERRARLAGEQVP
ncbi:Class II Aldolase and Adducin N-terminal domain [Gaiella occulta]|uniref:Class II Aldolase and Adducin N-terminal domain n=1 Tax=Gaiella occulta TaxID=1002870 RepID=A0A7M2Z077_9ACTN|nr:class II aldolase/adducin family protein [Gaiella occulta]RDI75816.1 Class II Aldolase and Adducin N-terminal domain [Gaiella occulta]